MHYDSSQLSAFIYSGWLATWPTQLLAAIWILWLISWVVASFWSGRTQKHVMTWDSQAYRLPILAGGILFTPWIEQLLGEKPLWSFGNVGIYVLVALTLAGISSGRTRSRARRATGSLTPARTDLCATRSIPG